MCVCMSSQGGVHGAGCCGYSSLLLVRVILGRLPPFFFFFGGWLILVEPSVGFASVKDFGYPDFLVYDCENDSIVTDSKPVEGGIV